VTRCSQEAAHADIDKELLRWSSKVPFRKAMRCCRAAAGEGVHLLYGVKSRSRKMVCSFRREKGIEESAIPDGAR